MNNLTNLKPLSFPPFTLEECRKSIENLHNRMQHGCGNGGCVIKKPTGMHTNAGCRCSPRIIARELQMIAKAIERTGYGFSCDWTVPE